MLAALVMSYLVYNYDVKPFLVRLSKKAGEYFESHEEIIKGFLKSPPELKSSLDFGTSTMGWSSEYPTQEQFIQ